MSEFYLRMGKGGTLSNKTILIFASVVAYVALFLFTMWLWLDIEIKLLGSGAMYASILFLPHGVRVISAWLLGPLAIVGLYPAHLFCFWIFNNFTFAPEMLVLCIPGAVCAPLAFELFRVCGLSLYPGSYAFDGLFWRRLLIVTIVASMLNSMLTTSYYVVMDGVDIVPELLTRFLFGDVFGTVVLMLLFATFRGRLFKWKNSIT